MKVGLIVRIALLVLLGSFLVLSIMIALTIASPNFAKVTYDYAYAAYEMGDNERAQRLFEEACDAGSKVACDDLRRGQEPS